MKAKVLLLIAASVALAGCPDKPAEKPAAPAPAPKVAPPPPAPATATTKSAATAKVSCPPDCAVAVTVSGTPCAVASASPDTLNVTHGNPAIRFTIVGSPPGTFRFPANGIAFPDPQPPTNPAPPPPADPKAVFPAGQFTGANTPVFTITDVNDKAAAKGAWKYTINVSNGSTNCTPLDPTIVNE